jgi:transcriptional regulator with XRE-family HTH domain
VNAPSSHARSPIAERIRARLAELGMSESEAALKLGKNRTLLSTILRRIDAGASVHDRTKAKLEILLGKSWQWVETGEEGQGVRLRECPGWEEAARLARERYSLTDEQIEHAGATTFPKAPRYLEPALVRALADAM